MKRSIHKGRESPFLLAVAALLFLGACGYLGVFLFEGLSALTEAPSPLPPEAPTALRGVALRNERVIDPVPGAEDGKRLTGRGIYFADCDGYETLTPALLDTLTPEDLTALLREPPGEIGRARLVEENAWYYAALLPCGEAPAPGPCRLRFSGFGESVPARLTEVREEKSGTLLLFRLLQGGEYLNLRFTEAEIERG